MAKPTVESQKFDMHPDLLFSIIERQAGTLEKAIAEGVMNAADAKARTCTVSVTANRVVIQDDGHGFPSREEIDKFFKTFGTPHKEGDATYGTFRMGRGQMFKFGVNHWRSGSFQMDVDIKNKGLHWDLTTHPKPEPGCRIVIELYDKLSPGMIAQTCKEVIRMLKYVEINGPEVFLNGEKISVDPATEDWDYTLPEGFVKLRRTGNLDVYNLGVLVKGYPCDTYGTGGTVVASQQLKVNFARNDVMVRDCKVWKALMKNVDAFARDRIEKSPSMNDSERARMAQALLDGELAPADRIKLRIFTDVCGRQWSMEQLMNKLYQHRNTVSLAPQGHRVGDTLHKMRAAFILGSDTSDRFNLNLPKLAELIKKTYKQVRGWAVTDFKVVPFEELERTLDSRGVVVPEDQWTPSEKVMMSLLHRTHYGLGSAVARQQGMSTDYSKMRKLCVGSSETALGWTDGQSYIAIERRLLTMDQLTLTGVQAVFHTFLHELCHDAPDTGTHGHTQEFYQLFHDCDLEKGRAVTAAMTALPKVMEDVGKKMTPKQLKDLDYLFGVEQGAARLTKKLAENMDKAAEAKEQTNGEG